MFPEAADQVTLGRVSLHLSSSSEDKVRWRRRVADTMGRVSLHAGLPPRAILVIRQMPDPLPGALLAGQAGRSRHQWGKQATTKLQDYWRLAVRPALEAVPPSAAAVWFADIAEWLACLSWDLHQGQTLTRWWWQTWLQQHSYLKGNDALFRLWQDNARWLPPALTGLQTGQRLGWQRLLLHLSPPQARHLRRLVRRAYSLSDGAEEARRSELLPALPEAVRSTVYDLPPEMADLVSLCLGIVYAPSAVRRSPRQTPLPLPRQPDDTAPPTSRASSPNPTDQAPAEAAAIASDSRLDPPAPVLQAGDPTLAPPADASRRPPTQLSASTRQQIDHATDETASNQPKPPPAEVRTEAEALAHPAAHRLPTEVTPFPAGFKQTGEPDRPDLANTDPALLDPALAIDRQGISSGLGGIWYLVNVLAEQAWLEDEASSLEAWQKFSSLGWALLADAPLDPVWELLAHQIATLAPEAEVTRWLAHALPAVQDYLATRLEQPETLVQALTDPATLFVTRTHVDVVFALDQIRLDLRLAGLDQDPGWVPELGRVITFHYQ